MSRRCVHALLVGALAVIGLNPLTTTASAVPAASASAPAVTGAAPARMLIDTRFEKRVISKTNRKRAHRGCSPVRFNRSLRKAARRHTYLMGRHQTLSHQLSGEPRLGRRVTRAGYTGWRKAAENIAVGYGRPGAVVRAWMRSPGHRRNILDCSLREIGVAVVRHDGRLWWTQNFGRR